MADYHELLRNNEAWAREKLAERPDFFERHATEQKPAYLWIGCSDSRVPAEEITGTEPGDIFVHRNIGNMVVHTDFNLLSVLQYAVQVLRVEHFLVCGHIGCGGIRTALSRKDVGLLNKWLRNIKDVYRLHAAELDPITDPEVRIERLTEINVIEQAHRLSDTSFVQKAWREEQRPTLHGWIYDIRNGRLRDLVKIGPGEHAHDIYEYDFGD